MRKTQSGVTLIELMIVVAVVAILAAIAYPSYQNQIQKSRRSEAKAALLQVQVAQEKHFLQNNGYVTTDALLVAAVGASPPGLGLATTTTNGYYTISVTTNGTAPSYLATATATGSQAGDTTCATFTIAHTGARDATSSSCW